MRYVVILLLVILFSGCSSTNEHTVQFYLLPSTENHYSADVKQSSELPLLSVNEVELADYLNSKGIVYRQSSTQIIQAKQNLWADNIKQQITKRLIDDLRAQETSYWPIASAPNTMASAHLLVSLNKFNGAYTGNAELAGEWKLFSSEGKQTSAQAFSIEVPLERDGYQALIFALSDALTRLSQEIAQHI
ncbi:ABC-type transport auxiliary lipoprotein family protein [Vibrio sp. LQ2]|uniref:PqiC family protein n=1 Tax=Vibrio sp. LQ2 TaxID=2883075 RepID=UPI001C9BF2A7|nr:ABC-type transport auxiliary lipoprotein family protein [Vibrio sp. LQ2]MBY7892429.1 membrane integrity-associated transporter subunit PqiC [Vibrio fluvialis]MBY7970775.1 membrane integrity-associated transporter subunit PqiC [Vibrio fluvialis]MBY8188165.1 membrane integrity-associated transporter subunit PqiC [Vibrio fluvialis]USP06940.1 ABC-type transport auxiliary lipoprotein family protein [Vibrio sp. LQ2]